MGGLEAFRNGIGIVKFILIKLYTDFVVGFFNKKVVKFVFQTCHFEFQDNLVVIVFVFK